MNLEQYQAFMDPELRVAFEQILPLFLNMPEDPVEVRKLMEQLPLPERQQSERVIVEDRHVPGPSGAPEVPVRIYTPASRTGTFRGSSGFMAAGSLRATPNRMMPCVSASSRKWAAPSCPSIIGWPLKTLSRPDLRIAMRHCDGWQHRQRIWASMQRKLPLEERARVVVLPRRWR